MVTSINKMLLFETTRLYFTPKTSKLEIDINIGANDSLELGHFCHILRPNQAQSVHACLAYMSIYKIF